jgi:pyruvate/2-oxoglutarate dehydrogenase complex dihydrolipoamide acyltransferase (E2) component
MSEYIFKLPDLGEGTVESEIGEWFVKVGDEVREEDIIGTVMTDKAAVEVSSPVSGKVVKLAGEPGDIIAVGAMLVVIDTVGTADEGRTTGAGESAAAPVEEACGSTSRYRTYLRKNRHVTCHPPPRERSRRRPGAGTRFRTGRPHRSQGL